MKKSQVFDLSILLLSVVALSGALGLAASYVNKDNPADTPFFLRPATYDKLFPFLLGTVAVGGFVLVYNREQKSKEMAIAHRQLVKATIDKRIHRLQDIYETVLSIYHSVKLQRRRLRGAYIPGDENDSWKIRRNIFEDVFIKLNEAQLAGERVVKTFDFEHDALKGALNHNDEEIERLKKLQSDMKSQIGGIQGILRNVLKTAELHGVTKGTSKDEDLINVTKGFIYFVDNNNDSNLGFNKIGKHFDAFSINIIKRIKELEDEQII